MNNNNRQVGLRRSALLLCGAFGVLLALTACSSSGKTQSSAGKHVLSSAASRPSDGTINIWIREAFDLDPRIDSGNINVDTIDGIVTLEGEAGNLLEKRYARLEADKISGVRGIIDKMTVKSLNRPDEDIKKDISDRLSQSPYGRIHDVAISVTDGDVVLEGHLPGWAQSDEAETIASEVRGVKSVTNRLIIDPLRMQSDDEKRDAIIAELNRDTYLTGLPISVIVEDGFATLEGTVGNAYEKQRAATDAYLATSLDYVNNNLKVDWLDERGVRDSEAIPADSRVKEAVREAFNFDSRLTTPSSINIGVLDGNITLDGTAPSYYESLIAQEDARNTVGAGQVTNFIYVAPGHEGDKAITNRITSALDSDWTLHSRDIGVLVEEGQATLTGRVDSYFQRRHAAQVASRIAGVRDVINEIQVNSQPGYTDAAITKRLSSYLGANWKTRPVADRIKVEVEDGNVVLRGSVNNWSERIEAERLARHTEGVLTVDDELVVEIS